MAKPSVLFPEPLGPIRGMDFAPAYLQTDPLEYWFVADVDVKIDDRKRITHARLTF